MKPTGKYYMDFDKKFTISLVDGKSIVSVGRCAEVHNGVIVFYDSDTHPVMWLPTHRVKLVESEAI